MKNQNVSVYQKIKNSFKRLPDFMIIGSQKSATSSLHSFLSRHSRIQTSLIKETHFYNKNFESGFEYYKSLFPFCSKSNLLFESTPDYLDHPLVPKRIYSVKPNTKFIVVLRNPSERAFSHYKHVQGYNNELKKLNFKEALQLENKMITHALDNLDYDPYNSARALYNYGFLRKGYYAKHIKHWFNYFSESQFHFLDFNDLISNNENTFDSLYKFLDIQKEARVFPKYNTALYESEMDNELRQILNNHFSEKNLELYSLLGRSFKW